MHTRQVAGLRHFPDGDEWALVEINRIDLRVHGPIRRSVLASRAVTKVASC